LQRLANGFEAGIWAEFGAKFDFLADLVRFVEIGDGGVFDTA